MKIEQVKTADLVPYLNNAKKHDRKQIQNVAESIRRYGFVQPIVIDRNDEVIIGHCRLMAAKLIGLDEVPCLRAEDLTEDQVKELRLIDNKTNESPWDVELLQAELETLDLSDFDIDWGIPNKEEEVVEVPVPENVESNTGGASVGVLVIISFCAETARIRTTFGSLWGTIWPTAFARTRRTTWGTKAPAGLRKRSGRRTRS